MDSTFFTIEINATTLYGLGIVTGMLVLIAISEAIDLLYDLIHDARKRKQKVTND